MWIARSMVVVYGDRPAITHGFDAGPPVIRARDVFGKYCLGHMLFCFSVTLIGADYRAALGDPARGVGVNLLVAFPVRIIPGGNGEHKPL